MVKFGNSQQVIDQKTKIICFRQKQTCGLQDKITLIE